MAQFKTNDEVVVTRRLPGDRKFVRKGRIGVIVEEYRHYQANGQHVAFYDLDGVPGFANLWNSQLRRATPAESVKLNEFFNDRGE